MACFRLWRRAKYLADQNGWSVTFQRMRKESRFHEQRHNFIQAAAQHLSTHGNLKYFDMDLHLPVELVDQTYDTLMAEAEDDDEEEDIGGEASSGSGNGGGEASSGSGNGGGGIGGGSTAAVDGGHGGKDMAKGTWKGGGTWTLEVAMGHGKGGHGKEGIYTIPGQRRT